MFIHRMPARNPARHAALGWKPMRTLRYLGGGGSLMKAVMLAVTAVALVLASAATPASAQRRGGGEEKGPHANPAEKPKPDEKAYKAALERIPDPKQKYDPWGGVAPAPTTTPATTGKKK
jgi:hypothetical protein